MHEWISVIIIIIFIIIIIIWGGRDEMTVVMSPRVFVRAA